MVRWLIGLILTTALLAFIAYELAEEYTNPGSPCGGPEPQWDRVHWGLWIPMWVVVIGRFQELALIATIPALIVYWRGIRRRPVLSAILVYAAVFGASAILHIGSNIYLVLISPFPTVYDVPMSRYQSDVEVAIICQAVASLSLLYAVVLWMFERRAKKQASPPQEAPVA